MLKKQRQPVNGLFQPHFTVKVYSLVTERKKHFYDYDTAREFFRRVCRLYGIHENDVMHGPGYLATPEIKYEYSVILF